MLNDKIFFILHYNLSITFIFFFYIKYVRFLYVFLPSIQMKIEITDKVCTKTHCVKKKYLNVPIK